MKLTTNLKLKKPDLTDYVNVEDFNENADILDTEVKALKDGSVAIGSLTTTAKTLQGAINELKAKDDSLSSHLADKVNKVVGKDLSTNDYTTTEKNKLAGLSNYNHPTTAGNKHIPGGGAIGQILSYGGSSGNATWKDAEGIIKIVTGTFTTPSDSNVKIDMGAKPLFIILERPDTYYRPSLIFNHLSLSESDLNINVAGSIRIHSAFPFPLYIQANEISVSKKGVYRYTAYCM